MKSKVVTILLVLALAAGLSLLLYPSISDYRNTSRHTREITSYVDEVTGLDPALKAQAWAEAEEFNLALLGRGNPYLLPEELLSRYEAALNTAGDGIMGYVEIPALQVQLPIHHGTSEMVLQRAVGHLEWSSLPVGGPGTHSVISGHRGLPSAKLFTDLGKLIIGDVFMLQVLDETLTYEVDQILIVLPEKVDDLTVIPGEDHCTLITCTPYGINTHRMLVRGRRITVDREKPAVRVLSEAVRIEPKIVAAALGVPLLLLLVAASVTEGTIRGRKKR